MQINSIFRSPIMAIDIETTGLERSDEICTVSISWLDEIQNIESAGFYVDRVRDSDEKERRYQNDLPKLKEILQKTLFNKDFHGMVLFHNAPFDVTRLLRRFHPQLGQQ